MSQVVTTVEQLERLVEAYSGFDEWAIDVETRPGREPYHDKDKPGLDCRTNDIFWISMAGPGRSDAIPVGHPLGRLLSPAQRVTLPMAECPDQKRCVRCQTGWKINKDGSVSRMRVIHTVPARFGPPPPQLSHEEVWPRLQPLLLGPARKIGHNVKFDAQAMAKYLDGRPMAPPYGDTLIAAWLVNENHGDGQYKLGPLVERHLRWSYDKSLGKKGVETFSFEEAAQYARLDALVTWLLWRRLVPRVEKTKQAEILELEMDVLRVVIAMEMAGAPIDVEAMEVLDESLRERLAEVQRDIEEWNGGEINLNAAAEIRELVYNKRRKKVSELTAVTKLPSTSAKALGIHAFRDPYLPEEDKWEPSNIKDRCVAAILERAGLHKVHANYLRSNLPVVREVGRLHAEFDQIGTVTGRFSSRSPNLQNIPARKGKEVRDLFIAGPGHKLIVSDYSQIELRMLAHFTQDPLLLRAYTDGLDLHSATARKAYGIPEDQEPTPEQRSLAKNTNFSMVFGATAWTLVSRYQVPEDVAQSLVDAFFATYKRVAPWQSKALRECRARARTKKRHGRTVEPWVETVLGRRRRLPDITLPEAHRQIPGRTEGETFAKARHRAERQAINSIIQGSAADLMKLAMLELHRRQVEERLPIELLMVVHDEAVLRVPEAAAEDMLKATNEAMESVNMLTIPLVAEGSICDRWSEGK